MLMFGPDVDTLPEAEAVRMSQNLTERSPAADARHSACVGSHASCSTASVWPRSSLVARWSMLLSGVQMRMVLSDDELARRRPSMLHPSARIEQLPRSADAPPGPVGTLVLPDDDGSATVPVVNGGGRWPPRSSLTGIAVALRLYLGNGGGGSSRSA